MALSLLISAGCQQEMARQPSYRPLTASAFFADGRSARQLVEGTVARGHLRDDPHFYTGKGDAASKLAQTAAVIGLRARAGFQALAIAAIPADETYVTRFPFPITLKVLERGRERYAIFCAPCHGPAGYGNGKIVERGFTAPPSYHDDLSRGFKSKGIDLKLRDAPVGYYFEVITSGFGAMADYAAQVPPRDRWAIIAYIRALQLSQRVGVKDLPEDERRLLADDVP